MFLALQVVLLLVGAGLVVVDVRLGIATWMALAMQFVSFMWMTLPTPHFAIQAAVFGGVALVAGLAMGLASTRLSWWATAVTSLAVLGVLRAVVALYWLAGVPISRVSDEALGKSTLALCLPCVLGFLAAGGLARLGGIKRA